MSDCPENEKKCLAATHSLQERLSMQLVEGSKGVKGLVNGIIAISSLTLSRFWPRINFIKRLPVQF